MKWLDDFWFFLFSTKKTTFAVALKWSLDRIFDCEFGVEK
jgi:hypothetical protein